MRYLICLFVLELFATASCVAQSAALPQEAIYDHKEGTALSLLILRPAKPIGKGIISMVSGNWVSSFESAQNFVGRATPFTDNGYTVFLVMHRSGPRYTIPDAVADVKRAIQFVRYNAASYGIDPAYIGITGTSSGGHLALMAGTSDDEMDAGAKDPVSRVSSKVQAVACFAPPTDFLNYGQRGFNPSTQKQLLQLLGVTAAFDFKELDSAKRVYSIIQDSAKQRVIAAAVSPAQLVTADDAPVYIMHGDADNVVPLQQSETIQKKLEAVKVPVVLKIKPGAGHGWKGMMDDEKEFVGWFDNYLKVKR